MMSDRTILKVGLSIVIVTSCRVAIGGQESKAPPGKPNGAKKELTYRGTVRVPFPGERRNVVAANPRKKGNHYFVSAQDGSIGARTDPADIEIFRYRVAMIQLVKLKDGSIVPPVMRVKYPDRVFVKPITFHDSWNHELQAFGPNVAPDDGWADFPVSDDIEKYLLLLKSFDEETGWRVLELKPSEIKDVKLLQIPDLLTLPPLDKRPDAKKLWKLHEDAKAEQAKYKHSE